MRTVEAVFGHLTCTSSEAGSAAAFQKKRGAQAAQSRVYRLSARDPRGGGTIKLGYVFHTLLAGGADTDVGVNPMIELIDNRTLMIVGCTALVLVGPARRAPGAYR